MQNHKQENAILSSYPTQIRVKMETDITLISITSFDQSANISSCKELLEPLKMNGQTFREMIKSQPGGKGMGYYYRTYSPTQRMLKQKPWLTDLLTSWSGMLSKPTWPERGTARAPSPYSMRNIHQIVRSEADSYGTVAQAS